MRLFKFKKVLQEINLTHKPKAGEWLASIYMESTSAETDYFATELKAFKAALETGGTRGALEYLNNRTPHRYTGIYRYDGVTLRNLAIYDKYDLHVTQGEDAPMEFTYCSLLQSQEELEIQNAAEDERVNGVIITPVVSYCGVLIRDENGQPFGSLCHFDMKRCQERVTDFPLLEAAAELLYPPPVIQKNCVYKLNLKLFWL